MRRIHVTVRNGAGNPPGSKTTTIYDTDAAEFMELISEAVQRGKEPQAGSCKSKKAKALVN
jgi:hypothetical protein